MTRALLWERNQPCGRGGRCVLRGMSGHNTRRRQRAAAESQGRQRAAAKSRAARVDTRSVERRKLAVWSRQWRRAARYRRAHTRRRAATCRSRDALPQTVNDFFSIFTFSRYFFEDIHASTLQQLRYIVINTNFVLLQQKLLDAALVGIFFCANFQALFIRLRRIGEPPARVPRRKKPLLRCFEGEGFRVLRDAAGALPLDPAAFCRKGRRVAAPLSAKTFWRNLL